MSTCSSPSTNWVPTFEELNENFTALLNGMVVVDFDGVTNKTALSRWLRNGVSYVNGLPPKIRSASVQHRCLKRGITYLKLC